jgi:subtilisin family serine protease
VKAQPARSLFGATGNEIAWAVLDTGVRATHTYFAGPKGKKQYRVVRDPAYNFAGGAYKDGVGHGTHVAGIIRKLAPECELYDFQVLDAKGEGSSFGIIQAMEKVRQLNQRPNGPVIHGANLSLGGPAQVASYAVGHSPECQEANRLVDSGVVVCVAASNDGYKELATIVGNEVEYYPTFMDIGIADPGNAEDVITVGSTHKTKPHTYGPSYFSSRGPTGDGRPKPDLLAPGEKILSASNENDTGEVEMSGTSMATPVVSGVVALFLSAYREFIGRPRDVKRLLMETCTDLGRDRYFQGAGLVDALRLLQAA